jgi:dTDP-glucose 4,6-dehydratase
MHKNILITGGCGFIASHFVQLAKQNFEKIVVLDALTYAAINAPAALTSKALCCIDDVHYYKGSINNAQLVEMLLQQYNIDVVVNFAAESHVDNSIQNCMPFIKTNVSGVATLLDACSRTWSNEFSHKRFIQVSTDEVFGSLTGDQESFTETTPYAPRNPYAASKAAGDHLIDAYVNTHGFPAIITHCCNNYGPGQHEEKLMPKVIRNAYMHKCIPLYGSGDNVREWIHAADHCSGILAAIKNGVVGEHYNFGSGFEISNIDLIKKICDLMHVNSNNLIKFVKDRAGHDKRYSIDSTKAKTQLMWQPKISFEDGLKQTIKWYGSFNNAISATEF